MRKLRPPTRDKLSCRFWCLSFAFTMTLVLGLLVILNPKAPLILGLLTLPGWIAALAVCGFAADTIGSNPWTMVVWPLANFVSYFVVARCFIGVLKIIEDIRNA